MHNFKEMKIWKESMVLAKEIVHLTDGFPREERYGMISQMNRCAISVPSNIAEGSSRKSNKEFAHFLRISLGSLFELETQVLLCVEMNYINDQKSKTIQSKITELQKMVYGFSGSLS